MPPYCLEAASAWHGAYHLGLGTVAYAVPASSTSQLGKSRKAQGSHSLLGLPSWAQGVCFPVRFPFAHLCFDLIK